MLLSLLFSHGTSILVVCESSILKLFLHFSESKACHVALLGGLIVLLSQRKGSEDALWESFSSGEQQSWKLDLRQTTNVPENFFSKQSWSEEQKLLAKPI